MKRFSLRGLWVVLGILAVGAAVPYFMTVAQTKTPVKPITPGATFPKLGTFKAVNPTGDPEKTPFIDFDLDAALEGRFTLLAYWVPGDPRNEEAMKDLNEWAAQNSDRATLIGIVPPRGRSALQVSRRSAALGMNITHLWDESYSLQRTFNARSAPFIVVIDPERIVRVLGAASPKHKIRDETTLVEYLDAALAGKGSPTIGQLGRYYPVTELIDSKYTDFALREVAQGQPVRFSDYVTDGKLTLLVFWSADCGHCKIELPEINKYYRQHKDRLNIVGVVKLADAGIKQRTNDFIRLHDLQFPTLADENQRVYKQYKVYTTPTTVVVGPSGKVEKVLLGSTVDLDKELESDLARLSKKDVEGA